MMVKREKQVIIAVVDAHWNQLHIVNGDMEMLSHFIGYRPGLVKLLHSMNDYSCFTIKWGFGKFRNF